MRVGTASRRSFMGQSPSEQLSSKLRSSSSTRSPSAFPWMSPFSEVKRHLRDHGTRSKKDPNLLWAWSKLYGGRRQLHFWSPELRQRLYWQFICLYINRMLSHDSRSLSGDAFGFEWRLTIVIMILFSVVLKNVWCPRAMVLEETICRCVWPPYTTSLSWSPSDSANHGISLMHR